MKKYFYLLLVASTVFLASCDKDTNVYSNDEIEINTPTDSSIETPIDTTVVSSLTGRTLTFGVNMELKAGTKAALSGLDINWQDGDYIGVATDNDATIRVYAVTPKSDAKKGTVTVSEVAGASKYYALFKGRLGHSGGAHEVDANDFSMIRFNTTTKTFYGNSDGDLSVGKQQVATGSLSSYLWWDNGYPLSMAGVATTNPSGSENTLIMRPCLALVKLQIASASVPAAYYRDTLVYNNPKYDVDHEHIYSAVRGFNLYQKAGSTIYSSGDFTVSVADNGALTTTVVDNENKREYRQLSQTEKLSSGTNYYMCIIPGGSITSFKIDFLGYANNTPTISWDAMYTMTNSGSYTVSPGDYFDFGTLNPLGLKKAQNEAADDAADEAAASYVPAITIDGNMADWAGIGDSFSNSSHSRIHAWKYKSDAQKVYLYLAFRKNRACTASSAGLYIGFDLDNNDATGNSYGNVAGCEAYVRAFPFTNASEGSTPVGTNGLDANSEVWASGIGYHNGTVSTYIYDAGEDIGSDSSNVYVEISIPREYLNMPAAGNSIKMGCSFAWYATDKKSVTLE